MAELPPLLHLLSLQPELVTDVLAWDVLALARLAQTSKAVHKIVMNSGVWRRICFRERVYYTNSKLSHVPITEDSTISASEARAMLAQDIAFSQGRFLTVQSISTKGAGTSFLSSSYLGWIQCSPPTLSLLGFRVSPTPVNAKLPVETTLTRPTLRSYALRGDRALFAFGSNELWLADLKALFAEPNQLSAWHKVHEPLAQGALAQLGPAVFARAGQPAEGPLQVTVFEIGDGTYDVKTVAKFPVPRFAAIAEILRVSGDTSAFGNLYVLVGSPTVVPNPRSDLLIVNDSGTVLASMLIPERAKGQVRRVEAGGLAMCRADGTVAISVCCLDGGQSRTEVFHVSLTEAKAEPATPQLAAKSNEFYLCTAVVPGALLRSLRPTPGPLLLGGVSGLGRIELVDPFDARPIPAPEPMKATTVIAKDNQGRDIPITITPGPPRPHNPGPLAQVLYTAKPQSWGKRVNRIVLRGRYAVIALDATVALFDWTEGRYLWRRTVSPTGNTDDNPIAELLVSPDGGAVAATTWDGSGLLVSLDASAVPNTTNQAKKPRQK